MIWIASLSARRALAASTLLAAGAMPVIVQAQQVVRDAETGQLRAPTAEEAAALRPSAPTKSTLKSLKTAPAEVTLADGSVMAATDESTLMYSVARRNADGSLSRYCVQGKAQAEKLSHTRPSAAKPVVAAKASREVVYELK